MKQSDILDLVFHCLDSMRKNKEKANKLKEISIKTKQIARHNHISTMRLVYKKTLFMSPGDRGEFLLNHGILEKFKF
jgi:hypothetical protein